MATYQPSDTVEALLQGTGRNSINFKNGLERLLNQQSESTHNQRSAAVDMFDLIQTSLGNPKLDQIPLEDVSGEKKYILLGDYALCLVDVGLKKSTGKNYTAGGLVNYVAQIHNAICRKCQGEGNTVRNNNLFKEMKKALEGRLKARDLKDQINLDMAQMMPLYKSLENVLSDYETGCDLVSIASNLMTCNTQGSHSATFCLKLTLNMQACGRTGKFVLLNYKDWAWDMFVQSLVVGWPEFKTLRKYKLTFGVDVESFVMSPFHAFGCAIIVDKFLVRPDLMRKHAAMYVFNDDYHNMT